MSISSSAAVSYTHLDVYKRQNLDIAPSKLVVSRDRRIIRSDVPDAMGNHLLCSVRQRRTEDGQSIGLSSETRACRRQQRGAYRHNESAVRIDDAAVGIEVMLYCAQAFLISAIQWSSDFSNHVRYALIFVLPETVSG